LDMLSEFRADKDVEWAGEASVPYLGTGAWHNEVGFRY
jgi:hypothetical protein